MKVSALTPPYQNRVKFSRRDLRFVPNESGCYALANYGDDILYVGQGDLRNRMDCHLNDSEKTAETKLGKAFWFYYLLVDSRLNRIEGGWVQQHEDMEGEKPILNKINPPMP